MLKPPYIKMILPGDGEVLVPGLGVVQTGIVRGALYHNLMIEPGTGHGLQQRLLLQSTGLLGCVVHLQQRVELSPVEVEILDKIVKIWSLVLYGLPNNLGEDSLRLYSVLYILYF